MKKGDVKRFFILGAGASVDSGMKTYRGHESLSYTYYDPDNPPMTFEALGNDEGMKRMWAHVEELKKDKNNAKIGATYLKLQKMLNDNCMVVTQNVDGLIHAIDTHDARIVEIHGHLKTATCLKCNKTCDTEKVNHNHCGDCGSWLRPDIVLLGENVNDVKGININSWINRNHPTECYVIGTTLQFSYLRNMIISCRKKGARVIHVNTDPEYEWHCMREKTAAIEGLATSVLVRRKKNDELRNKL